MVKGVGPMGGGDLLCRVLEAKGATTVFGVPGTQNVGLFDSLRRSKLRTVLASSELGAAFMANGFFRASGEPGVLTTIPGPGFTFALTGLAEARHDSAAVVMVVPKRAPAANRPFQLQDIDQRAIAEPIVKRFFRVDSSELLASTVDEAWSLSLQGEPGPVIIEVDNAVLEERGGKTDLPVGTGLPLPGPEQRQVDRAIESLLEAERILVFIGQGASGASEAVRELVEALGACAISTSSGRGVIPDPSARMLSGDFSGWGTGLANKLIGASDLVLVLGCKLSHNGSSGFRLRLPSEKMIRVDSSLESFGGEYPASLEIHSDIGEFLDSLKTGALHGNRESRGWALQELEELKGGFERERKRSSEALPRLSKGDEEGLSGFFGTLREALPDDCILVTDSGIHQTAVRRGFEVRDTRGLIMPADFQSMGFGLPAAIGARMAAPERQVVAVVGDGGMAMAGLELTTAVREGMDLTVIVFNDGHLGQIRLQQISDTGVPFSTELGGVSFQPFAEAIGASYLAVDGTNVQTLHEAVSNPGVTLVDVLLSESPHASRLRTTGLIKAGVRKAIGAGGIRVLKNVLRRRYS